MPSKPLESFIVPRTITSMNESNATIKQPHIPVKPALPTIRKFSSHKALVQVNKKRKVDVKGSKGPLKKRHLITPERHGAGTHGNGQLCAFNKNEEHVQALFLLQSFDKAMPISSVAYHFYPPLVKIANDSSIHKSQDNHALKIQSIQDLFNKRNLDALLHRNVHDERRSSFGTVPMQGKYHSNSVDSSHGIENELPALTKQLSIFQDEDNLSEVQCLIRKNIELFTATKQDVNAHFRGRNWSVEIGQVGLRCKHCYKTPQEIINQPKSSRYFPLTLSGIYQAAQNIFHFHFKNERCPCMPQNVMSEFRNTKRSRSYYGGGKQYWTIAAESLGLVESASGLRFKSNKTNNSLSSMQASKENTKSVACFSNLDMSFNAAACSEKSIVNPEDRSLVTDYMFMIMCQMVQFPTNNDEIDSNTGNIGLSLCCKHCMGENRKGVFSRTKVTSISKNEYFNQVHSHLESCSHCPNQLKEALNHFKELHDLHKRKLKRGNRKEFFNRILNRMSLK